MPNAEPYDEVEEDCNVGRANISTGRGKCPQCGLSMPIRSGSGRLWHHGPNNKYRCRGSGEFPVPGSIVPNEAPG